MNLRLHIDGLSHDGRGVARIDGKVGFVAGALAGEVVDAALTRRHGRFDDYRLLEVREPAPQRVVPRCPLVGRCGGCDLQHLDGDAQRRHKSAVVVEQLQRQAGLEAAELAAPVGEDAPQFGYRRRARLAVAAARRGSGVTVGFREAAGTRIVGVERCPVLVDALAELPGRLQALFDTFERAAVVAHVELSVSESDDGASAPVIGLRLTGTLHRADRARLFEFADAHAAFLAVRTGSEPFEVLSGAGVLSPGYRLPEFGLRIGFAPDDFIQANGAVNRQLVTRVADWLDLDAGTPVLDAFCGVGNFTLALARRGLHVLGLEASPSMVARARDNAAAHGLDTVDVLTCDLMAQPATLPRRPFAAALLDPPRDGARALVGELAARRVERILYVSCRSATLARDARILADAGYRLARLAIVDMFPQTSHVETMALFLRAQR